MGALVGYDVIGDIHGHARLLEKLLSAIGYEKIGGVWRHGTRQALFVGDLIDRGDESVRTYRIVRAMVESGAARCVMGNHEYNAVCYFTPDPDRPGKYLRKIHSEKNRRQHGAFLAEVGPWSPLHAEIVAWFQTLPLWLELPELCVVHACWSESCMDYLRPTLGDSGIIPPPLYPASTRNGQPFCEAIREICKGAEGAVAQEFLDKDGNPRDKARICWWREQPEDKNLAITIRDGGREELTELREPLTGEWPLRKPTFFGHYWLTPDAPKEPRTPLAACTDFSAGRGGPLACYRFDFGDTFLTADKFFCVDP